MRNLVLFLLTLGLFPGILPAQGPGAQATPAKADISSGETVREPAEEPGISGDEKLDPETQRMIREAREKIIRERAEKLAAEKKAAADEARRKEEEKLKSQKKQDSRVYVGATGMLGISLNSFTSSGFAFGGTLDTIFAKHFGLHFGFATGSFKTKGSSLKSGNSTLAISAGDSIGYLEFDVALNYIFPKFFNVEASLGGGMMVHQLGAKAFGFGSQAAPMILASAFTAVVPYIELGVLTNIAFPIASNISSASGSFTLDEKQSLTALSLFVSVRLLVH